MKMKIIRYRTVAVVYPHLSLEAEVLDDTNGKKYYVNMDVNDKGMQETLCEDFWCSYDKPLDQINDGNMDDSFVYLDFCEVLQQMLDFWNANPVFVNDENWKNWGPIYTLEKRHEFGGGVMETHYEVREYTHRSVTGVLMNGRTLKQGTKSQCYKYCRMKNIKPEEESKQKVAD